MGSPSLGIKQKDGAFGSDEKYFEDDDSSSILDDNNKLDKMVVNKLSQLSRELDTQMGNETISKNFSLVNNMQRRELMI